MNALKKIAFVFTTILLFLCLGLWIISQNITHKAVKDLINDKLSAITTEKSHIEGDVLWQLFPHPGIKITQIQLIDNHYSLFIENLILNLQITSLLHRQLVFKEVKIDGLTVSVKNPDNQLNTVLNKVSNLTISKNNPVGFDIERFSLKNGQITITQPKQKTALTHLQIQTKDINFTKEFFPLQFQTTLLASYAGNKIKTTLKYNGKIRLPSPLLLEPSMALQNIGLNGQMELHHFRFNQFKLSKLSSTARTKKGTLVLNPLIFSLYGGQSQGDLHYQFATKKLSFNQSATHLNANQLLKNFSNKTLMTGDLTISWHGSINFQDDNWQKTCGGDGRILVQNGILYFIDLQALADSATKKINSLPSQDQTEMELALNQPLIKAHPQGATAFNLLNIDYHLLNGTFFSDRLFLETNRVQLKGSGALDLNTQSLNGSLSAKLVTNDTMVAKIQGLLGGSFPLQLTGTLNQPEILPNEKSIKPILTRYMVKNAIGFPVRQIKQQIETLISVPDLLISN